MGLPALGAKELLDGLELEAPRGAGEGQTARARGSPRVCAVVSARVKAKGWSGLGCCWDQGDPSSGTCLVLDLAQLSLPCRVVTVRVKWAPCRLAWKGSWDKISLDRTLGPREA